MHAWAPARNFCRRRAEPGAVTAAHLFGGSAGGWRGERQQRRLAQVEELLRNAAGAPGCCEKWGI